MKVFPTDNIQAAIDAFGGPGTSFELMPGDYSQEIVLRGEVPTNNGARGNPMRIILSEGVTLNPASDKVDTIRFAAASYVTLEGKGKINGAGDDSRQAIHIHSAPKKNMYPTGIEILGVRVLPKRGDGIKASETIDLRIDGVEVDGQYLRSEKESLIDCNKFINVTIRNTRLVNHPNSALILKGGGVGALIEGVTIANVLKGVEVGGYEGSGYWDQIDNQWAAKDVTIRNCDFEAKDYPIRFIDAHDVSVENTQLKGDRTYLVTSTREINRGRFVCSNITVNGEMIVSPVIEEETTPVDTTPEPTPTPEETPAPAPTPVEAPYTYVKGDNSKITIKTEDGVVPTITLRGFTVDEVELVTKEKSKSKVIIDLRKIDGPRLTLKGKGARDTWRSSVVTTS
jgi:hypothetical protein